MAQVEGRSLLMHPKDVMAEYGFNKNTLYDLLKNKTIPSVDISPKAGKKKRHRPTYRIPRGPFEAWLAGQKVSK